jgi:hypothetical protein
LRDLVIVERTVEEEEGEHGIGIKIPPRGQSMK